MNSAIPLRGVSVMVAAFAFGFAGIGPAGAEPMPDRENGRYTMQPSGDGVIRLDTRTGAVSNCSDLGAGWACYEVPDERKALDEEIGRLRAENDRLKAQLAARDGAEAGKIEQPPPKPEVAPKSTDGERKIEIPLPSDADMDRVMSFLERAWRRLIDMANRVQKDVAGRI